MKDFEFKLAGAVVAVVGVLVLVFTVTRFYASLEPAPSAPTAGTLLGTVPTRYGVVELWEVVDPNTGQIVVLAISSQAMVVLP